MLQKKISSPALRRALKAALSLLFAVALAIVIAVLENHGGSGKPDSSGPPAPDRGGPVGSAKEISALLGKLKVADEMPMTGYARERFPHWDTEKPEHGFGDTFAQYSLCTTRDVVLLRDATGPVKLDPSSCKLTVGTNGGWRDQYGVMDKKTNALKPYKWTTDSSGLDIDHIVALAEAWRSGAAKFDDDTRRHIANDALNLVISDPTANRSKGDQDPSSYLPPGNFRCAYIGRYIQVKVKYGLNVDAKEQSALQTAVADCASKGEFT
ncbi:HNH endonuclease family protein [Nocardia sp. CDC160]|uniref:HNH endonuclease family protein n=1 Tax=Nocardia sp. CDC160 TaxID=3112166 RepID=UPI002DB9602E|nr:HNH endonuclease family protein [Nocardia sp. CDC160]MEC3917547.1 HNH endonuclease family protein [Nocardia sp. CDC160]